VGIDVELADNFAVNEYRNNDLGPGFERTGEITRIRIDIIDDDGFACGGCGSAEALVERDASVGCRRSFEGAEGEDIVATLFFKHVEADPVVVVEFFVEERNDTLHERVRRSSGFGECVESWKKIARPGVHCGHGD